MLKKLLVTASVLSLGLISVENVNAQIQDTSEVSVTFTEDTAPLRIDNVTNFSFNNAHNIEGFSTESNEGLTAIIVDNNGAGLGAGWSLNASLSDFTMTSDATSSLNGATIELNSGVATSSNDFVAPTVTPVIELSADATLIANANRTEGGNTGYGTWTINWEAANVLLNVPAEASTPGEHTATVTWELSDVPQ